MSMLAGDLAIRDSEPTALAQPTTITGTADDQTGALSIASFDTPTITFERPVEGLIRGTAVVDATFTEVASGTGSIDPEGHVVLRQAVTVDIHVEVFPEGASAPLNLAGDCRSTPVVLDLLSDAAAPYDPATGRVAVTATNFTIPAAPITAACESIIGSEINDALAGSGHNLSLVLEGTLPIPPPVGCTTTTTVAVTPEGTSELASPLAFEATVTPDADDPECIAAAADDDPLSGDVDFLADGAVIGSAALEPDGTAAFTTPSLPAGPHELTARFRGRAPYLRSTSTPQAHIVTAPPAVTSNLPPFVEIDGGPVEFDIDLHATGLAAPVTGGHIELTLAYTKPGVLTNATSMSVEVLQGETWVPITLALGTGNSSLFGRVADLDVTPGTASTLRLRATFGTPNPNAPSVGEIGLTFEYVPAEATVAQAPAPGALARGTALTTLTRAARLATFLQASAISPTLTPHTVRQGSTVVIGGVSIRPNAPNGHSVTGYAEYFLDGVPVDVAPASNSLGGDVRRLAVTGGVTPWAMFQLPPSIPIGVHVVTIRYSGDAAYEPAQMSVNLTALASLGGTHYECRAPGSPAHRFRAAVVAQGNLPVAAPAGTEVSVDHLAVRLVTDRGQFTVGTFVLVPNGETTDVGPALEGVAFDLGPDGVGSATALTRSGGTVMPVNPNPATDVDHIIDPLGETATVAVSGAVGDVIPVTLERIRIDMRDVGIGISANLVCMPVGDPIELGRVRVSGVDLSVTPARPTRAGDDVILTADLGHEDASGVMELRAGATTLGVVPVAGSSVVFTTDDLAVGDHDLNARYFPHPIGPMQVSGTVAHTVLPEHDCEAFTSAGTGAVVRLVYLELLGRCPDQAGFDYWTGRLDSGTSAEVFARTIARTPEAVGRVVDDAYETMLGRAADPAGRTFWTGRLQASGRYDALLADLGASGEFWSKAGSSNTGFVTRVYDRLLNRAPDTDGRNYWVGRLDAGGSRRALIVSLANLDEPLGRIAAASYGEILDRAPFAGERRDAITFLRETGDRSGLYTQLIGRPEFATRAQGLPNRDD